jgi:PD-(D/E)XK endonuclease
VPELTTNQKGALAEASIAKEAAKLGIIVLRPLDDARYDLVLDLSIGLMRVQCKWAVRRRDVVVIRCRTCRRGRDGLIHGGYKQGEIDAIAAYCAELDTCYLLPLSLSVIRAAVQLRLAPTLNNQQRKIHWAKDYEFDARLSSHGPIAQLGERLSGTQEVGGSIPPGSIAASRRLF